MSVVVADQFQSLYRRYRPQRFAEVRGQAHVVPGLRNAVRDERVAHAYLFSGPRGTGKTSTARILAKALNCASPEEGEPCGRCDSCLDIARGASLDVHELDAASNNGVEAMRDLVARASLATPGKWKVYIVDEVHMLSTAASNALLKTLEEPPSHVVFVLATTDPQKVLPTIRSRTQHFEFHLLEPSTLVELLGEVAQDARLELPPEGIEAAVRRAHGSARDALSALDLVVAAGFVEDDGRFVRDLIGAIAERDTHLALGAVEQAMVAGLDAARLAAELVDGLREIFLSTVAPDLDRSSRPAVTSGEGDSRSFGPARCVRALEMIGKAIVDMHDALDARTTLEVALVRLTHPEVDDGAGAILERLERLERRVHELGTAQPSPAPPSGALPRPAPPSSAPPRPAPLRPAEPRSAPPSGAPPSGDSPALGAYLKARGAPDPAPTPAPTPASASLPAEAVDPPPPPLPTRDDLVIAWGDHVLAALRPRARAVYNAGRFVDVQGGVAVFALPNSAHLEHAAPLVDEVADALSRHLGVRLTLRLVSEASDSGGAAPGGGEDRTGGSGLSRSPADAGTAMDSGDGSASRRDDRSSQRDHGRAASAEDGTHDEHLDVEDISRAELGGRHDSLSWAEGRLLEAFPGAEEVP